MCSWQIPNADQELPHNLAACEDRRISSSSNGFAHKVRLIGDFVCKLTVCTQSLFNQCFKVSPFKGSCMQCLHHEDRITKATLVLPLLYGILNKGNTYFFEIPPLLLSGAWMLAFKKKRR